MPTDTLTPVLKGGPLEWRPTKVMNMRDLSMDDDFLSHLLVEKLGTGDVPLHVHKMDSSRRLPKTDARDLLKIVRRLVKSKASVNHATRQAVDELLQLGPIRYYLREFEQKKINAFATHASRYFELYHPSGCIEIAHTSRYAHRTGKAELCILATRNLAAGAVITELKGSLADLTDQEDRELKQAGLDNPDIRRDFSVIHSKQMKKNHLFLGPARFVNHDCENNCELFREGRYITFKVLRPIALGQEITAHYGTSYFGKRNRDCLCESCERNGKGGYTPRDELGSDSESDSDSDISDTEDEVEPAAPANLDERRTRRGVYQRTQPSTAGVTPIVLNLETNATPTQTTPASHTPTTVLSTPTTTRSASSLSSVSIVSSTSTAVSSATSRSTRRQQKTLQTKDTPMNEVEPEVTSQTSSRRVTRSIVTSSKVKEKQPAPVVATSTSAPVLPRKRGRPPKVKGKEQIKIKKEPDTEEVVIIEKKPLVGPDGKQLPLCATCKSILPVISIDSKVVWGLELDTNPSNIRKLKVECPRCIRHFAIYGEQWPKRAGNGSATDASTSQRVTIKILPLIDRKLNASKESKDSTSSSSSKSLRRRREPSPDMASKRRKIDPLPPPPATAPARPTQETPVQIPQAVQELPPAESASAPPIRRKRGRPRKHPLPEPVVVVKQEDKTEPQPFKDQPREPNGRFHKKPRSPKNYSPTQHRSRAQRAMERDKVKATDDVSTVKLEQAVLPLPKRARILSRPTLFRGASLFYKPSPLNFAIKAWTSPSTQTDSLAETDSSGPSTCQDPIDVDSPAVTVHVVKDKESRSLVAAVRIPSLMQPNPFKFARRRWSGDEDPVASGSDDTSVETSQSPESTAPERPLKRKRDAMYREGKYMSPFRFTYRSSLAPAFTDEDAPSPLSDNDNEPFDLATAAAALKHDSASLITAVPVKTKLVAAGWDDDSAEEDNIV